MCKMLTMFVAIATDSAKDNRQYVLSVGSQSTPAVSALGSSSFIVAGSFMINNVKQDKVQSKIMQLLCKLVADCLNWYISDEGNIVVAG